MNAIDTLVYITVDTWVFKTVFIEMIDEVKREQGVGEKFDTVPDFVNDIKQVLRVEDKNGVIKDIADKMRNRIDYRNIMLENSFINAMVKFREDMFKEICAKIKSGEIC